MRVHADVERKIDKVQPISVCMHYRGRMRKSNRGDRDRVAREERRGDGSRVGRRDSEGSKRKKAFFCAKRHKEPSLIHFNRRGTMLRRGGGKLEQSTKPRSLFAFDFDRNYL